MRVFLSYGHDANAELVNLIYRDLRARGHDVWIDREGIKGGHDWRRRITEEILRSDRVLAFLSRHSVRDPGVCCDELAIALGAKGGNIQTVLVEPEDVVRVPASVSHVQWLDMQDWQDRRASGGEAWLAWYSSRLAEIVQNVESDESRRFAGEIEALERHLTPISGSPRVSTLLRRKVVGRRWVDEAIEGWRRTADRHSRLFWILGPPGVGKSSYAARLAHFGSDRVIAGQFCEWDKPDHRDASRVVRSIAFQLATRLPDYRKVLLALPELGTLSAKNGAELFDYLLARPLDLLIGGGRGRQLVVIDAIDEASDGNRNALVELLARDAPRLPDWIAWVVTSRPDPAVMFALQALHPFVLDAGAPENLADMREYLRRELASVGRRSAEGEALVERIVEKSEGVFLYAVHLCDEFWRLRSPGDLDTLPDGLSGAFAQYFQRLWPDATHFTKEILPALRAILAARAPLPTTVLRRMMGSYAEAQHDFTRALATFFPTSKLNDREVIRPYHKAVTDWLTDPAKAGPYFVSTEEGHHYLALHLLAEYRAGNSDPFALAHLPYHFVPERTLPPRNVDALARLLESSFFEAKAEALGPLTCLEDLELLASALAVGGPACDTALVAAARQNAVLSAKARRTPENVVSLVRNRQYAGIRVAVDREGDPIRRGALAIAAAVLLEDRRESDWAAPLKAYGHALLDEDPAEAIPVDALSVLLHALRLGPASKPAGEVFERPSADLHANAIAPRAKVEHERSWIPFWDTILTSWRLRLGLILAAGMGCCYVAFWRGWFRAPALSGSEKSMYFAVVAGGFAMLFLGPELVLWFARRLRPDREANIFAELVAGYIASSPPERSVRLFRACGYLDRVSDYFVLGPTLPDRTWQLARRLAIAGMQDVCEAWKRRTAEPDAANGLLGLLVRRTTAPQRVALATELTQRLPRAFLVDVLENLSSEDDWREHESTRILFDLSLQVLKGLAAGPMPRLWIPKSIKASAGGTELRQEVYERDVVPLLQTLPPPLLAEVLIRHLGFDEAVELGRGGAAREPRLFPGLKLDPPLHPAEPLVGTLGNWLMIAPILPAMPVLAIVALVLMMPFLACIPLFLIAERTYLVGLAELLGSRARPSTLYALVGSMEAGFESFDPLTRWNWRKGQSRYTFVRAIERWWRWLTWSSDARCLRHTSIAEALLAGERPLDVRIAAADFADCLSRLRQKRRGIPRSAAILSTMDSEERLRSVLSEHDPRWPLPTEQERATQWARALPLPRQQNLLATGIAATVTFGIAAATCWSLGCQPSSALTAAPAVLIPLIFYAHYHIGRRGLRFLGRGYFILYSCLFMIVPVAESGRHREAGDVLLLVDFPISFFVVFLAAALHQLVACEAVHLWRGARSFYPTPAEVAASRAGAVVACVLGGIVLGAAWGWFVNAHGFAEVNAWLERSKAAVESFAAALRR